MSMKKIIALALALCMALSMVAFAGYTDADSINEDLTGDIELVTALGLMKGNDDGSFNPNGTLTRGEAAVIIYRLHYGKSTIDASWGDESLTKYSDLKGHWSVPYVNYASALGFIEGNPDGTFRPNQPVTAIEMAKMLLTVAGYSSEKQGYAKNWPTNALTDAMVAGLYTDYEAAFTGAAPRQWIAKMVVNMLDVKKVSYVDGELTPGAKFGNQYNLKDVTGMVVANDVNGIVAPAGLNAKDKKQATIKDKDGNELDMVYTMPIDMIGREVKVYFKESGDANGLDVEDKVYAVIDKSTNETITTLNKITLDEEEFTVNGNTIELSQKAGAVETVATYESLATGLTFAKDAVNDTRAATVFYNPTFKQYVVMYNKVEFEQVKKNDAEDSIFTTVSGDNLVTGSNDDEKAESYAAIKGAADVKKDDYIAIETVGNQEKTYTVTKLSPVTVKISSVTGTGNSAKFVSGTTTFAKNNVYMTDENYATFVGGLNATTLTKEYDLYLDGSYVIFAEAHDAETAASGLNMDIAYLIAAKLGTGSDAFATNPDQVQVLLPDGSVNIFEYDDKDVTGALTLANTDERTPGSGETVHGHIYKMVVSNDGTVYFMALSETEEDSTKATVAGAITAVTVADKDNVTKTTVSIIGGEVVYGNADSFLFAKLQNGTKMEYSVIKLSELNGTPTNDTDKVYTYGFESAYLKDSKTGMNVLAYGVLVGTGDEVNGQIPGTESDTGDWFLVTNATVTATVTEDDTTYAVKGINAKGVSETLTLTSNKVGSVANLATTDIQKGNIYLVKTEVTADGTEKYLVKSGAATETTLFDTTGTDPVLKVDAWHKTTIIASTGSSVLLADATYNATTGAYTQGNTFLADLADDAVITYIYSGTNISLKTADAPASIPFTAKKQTTAEYNNATLPVWSLDASGTYYKCIDTNAAVNSGWKCWFNNAWADCDDGLQADANYINGWYNAPIYSLVKLNADGEVSEIIIEVTSKTSNTQKTVSVDFAQ